MEENFFEQIFNNEDLVKIKEKAVDNILKFNTRTIVIVDKFENESEDKTQIIKILNACKLQSEDFYITDEAIPFAVMKRQDKVKEIIIFGRETADVCMSYQLIMNQFCKIDKVYVLKMPALNIIMNNPQLKNQFWNLSLKPHYLGE